MAAVGDIFKVIMRGGVLGQEFLNVFYYRLSSQEQNTPGSALLRGAFIFGVLNPILSVLSEQASVFSIYAYNLFDPFDLSDASFEPSSGTRTGDVFPPFVSWSFRTFRPTRSIRRGFKRFAGVSETDVQSGIAAPNITPLLNQLAVSLSNPISNGFALNDNKDFVPVVVKRVKEVDPVTQEVSYRDPQDAAEAQFFDAVSWSFQGLTTQNTRK